MTKKLYARQDFKPPYGDTLLEYLNNKKNLKRIKKDKVLYILPEEGELQPTFDSSFIKDLDIEFILCNYEFTKKLKDIKVTAWPNYFLYNVFYYRNSDFIDTETNNIKYLFTLLNGRPRDHRIHLMDVLAKYNLLESNPYTWHKISHDFKFKYWKQELKTLDGKFIHRNQYSFPKEMYQSVINLIPETAVDIPFISEKTWNPIIYKKPFIILGHPGIHCYLESIGYKLPRHVIDYSFDNESNTILRIEMIAKELRRLSTLDLKTLHKECKAITEHNHNLAKTQVLDEFDIPKIMYSLPYYREFIEDTIEMVKNNKKHDW